MNRERAETFLQVLAEAELRRATSRPRGDAQRAGYADRVRRVAQVLVLVGALDERAADQILDDFELAFGLRQAGQAGSAAGWFPRRAARRTRLARRAGAPAAAAGRSAAVRPGTGTAGRTGAPVPLGQMIRVRGADADSQVCLLSYARVASGPQFSVFARERQPSGRWEPSGPRLFDPLTATDDRGTSYQVTIRDIGSPVLGWTLMLLPDPPHDPQWLDLATTTAGGGPAARIILPAAAGQTQPPAAAGVAVSQMPSSPGEHLLGTIAARLLAAVPPLPHDPWLYGTAPQPRPLPGITDGLGDVIAALQECGALPPHSPVPGQLATLCARLHVTGHGITTPPGRDLPGPWLSVLTQYQHRETRAPVPDGCAAAAAVLPELDGIQLTILGLHTCQDSTIMHMHASGPACHIIYGPDEPYSWPPVWICDSGGRWHVTRTSGQSGMNGEIALRLEIVPPLNHATTWIKVRATGQAAQARATLQLPWQAL
jgi:hypothetical protein